MIEENKKIDLSPVDCQEDIDRCLVCPKTECTNCLEYMCESKRKTLSVPVAKLSKISSKVIATYPSVLEAANKNGINPKNISGCLHGKSKTAGGYKWMALKKGGLI